MQRSELLRTYSAQRSFARLVGGLTSQSNRVVGQLAHCAASSSTMALNAWATTGGLAGLWCTLHIAHCTLHIVYWLLPSTTNAGDHVDDQAVLRCVVFCFVALAVDPLLTSFLAFAR